MAGAALVTGAASGIGRATAYALAARGYRVAVDHLGREAEAKQVAADIGGIAYEADVADAAAVEQLVADVETDLGAIEVAVACAGLQNPYRSVRAAQRRNADVVRGSRRGAADARPRGSQEGRGVDGSRH